MTCLQLKNLWLCVTIDSSMICHLSLSLYFGKCDPRLFFGDRVRPSISVSRRLAYCIVSESATFEEPVVGLCFGGCGRRMTVWSVCAWVFYPHLVHTSSFSFVDVTYRSGELWSGYMHCNGCETLQGKDVNVCLVCYSKGKLAFSKPEKGSVGLTNEGHFPCDP